MQRLNPPDPSNYNDDQKRTAESISGTRGSIRGPFGPWLHAPGFADPAQQVGAFLRFGSKMPGNLRELAICTVGQYWQANYEWFAHAPLAIDERSRLGSSTTASTKVRRVILPLLDRWAAGSLSHG